jgi:hypothetical protein
MKNIFILTFLLFTPVTLFAEDNSSSDIDYYAKGVVGQINFDGESYTGYGAEFQAVSEKFTFDAGYAVFDFDGHDLDVTGAEVTYSFGSNFEGSFFIGIDYSKTSYRSDSDSDTGFSIGYHKFTPNELSWDVGISDDDGDATFDVGIRIPVEENFGISLGFSTSKDEDDDTFNTATVGFDYSF